MKSVSQLQITRREKVAHDLEKAKDRVKELKELWERLPILDEDCEVKK